MSKIMTINQFIARYQPICEGAEWLRKQRNLKRAWEICRSSDWMLWALERIGYDDEKVLQLYVCWCVRYTELADGRTVWDLLTDGRSRRAVEMAERYALGEATDEELSAAWDAWDAAWDAAGAASGSAWDAARNQQANHLREVVPWDVIKQYINQEAAGE